MAHPGNGFGAQPGQVCGVCRVQEAPGNDRIGAPFFRGRIIQERVRARVQDFLSQGRRAAQVAAVEPDLTVLACPKHFLQAGNVHQVVQAIVDGLFDQRMPRYLPFPDEIILASQLIGEDHCHQVFSIAALELRGDLPPAVITPDCQGRAGVPAPVGGEHGRCQQGLGDCVPDAVGVQVPGCVFQGETVDRAQRDNDAVIQGRGLQFKVELAAETLAQPQAPGAVDAGAVGAVQHQVLVAGFVKKPFKHDILPGWNASQCGAGAGQVVGQLAGGSFIQLQLVNQPAVCGISTLGQFFIHGAAQSRDRAAQFIGPARRLAEPERDIGRLAPGVRHPHFALFDLEDSIRGITKLEDVARQTLEGEVFVQRPDKMAFRFQHHVVVELVRYHPAVGHGSQFGALPGPDALVYRVMVDVTAAPAAPGREALRQHAQHLRECLPAHATVRVSQRHLSEQFVFSPFLAGGLRNQLLRQHVQVVLAYAEPVQLVAPYRVQQRRAFHQVIPAQREQAPLGGCSQAVAGAPDPLQEDGDGSGRAELADQVHVPDVDSQFQGRGCHQRLEFSPFQPLFGIQAVFLCQAAVVGGHVFFADTFRQGAGCAFCQAPVIDEDQGGLMAPDQICQFAIQFLPYLTGHYRLQR